MMAFTSEYKITINVRIERNAKVHFEAQTYRSGGEVWSKEDGHDSNVGILASS